ncbi:hypothetical protein CLU79DRAFT_772849 [Phycomyces nitens]|nr:hypothetical protein CLU79DRAFT_772849 [Phycomyces nitens]
MTDSQPTLPSIAHLFTSLRSSSPPALTNAPPTLNFSPPSPRLQPSPALSPLHSPYHQKSSSYFVSPLLSPIDSLSSQSCPLSLRSSSSSPPLQGHDPPQSLVRCPSSPVSLGIPQPNWTHTRNYCYSRTPSPLLSPVGSAISSRSLSFSAPIALPGPAHIPKPQHKEDEDEEEPLSPSSSSSSSQSPLAPTQILFNASGQPVLKRRRGRPPSTRGPAWEGGWTFMTPTVWDVNAPAQPIDTSSLLPSYTIEAQGNMATAFTNANMDTVLHMPKKKRGRKPKTQLEGNSCFVWKEITSTRTVKPKLPPKTVKVPILAKDGAEVLDTPEPMDTTENGDSTEMNTETEQSLRRSTRYSIIKPY